MDNSALVECVLLPQQKGGLIKEGKQQCHPKVQMHIRTGFLVVLHKDNQRVEEMICIVFLF